jgi:hypothetical protein
MQVKIGPYRNWLGPYQLAEALCFWAKDVEDEYGIKRKPEWVHQFGEFLAHGFHKETPEQARRWFGHDRPKTWLYRLLEWIHKHKHRQVKVKIDHWDTWSMDYTLALIILPMLKQMRATKHGSQIVDLEDVPVELRADGHYDYDAQKSFDFYHEVDEGKDVNYDMTHRRWDWVLDEMIFAFDHLVDDSWEDQYRQGDMDSYMEPCAWDESGKPKLYEMKRGPNDTYQCDYDAIDRVNQRMNNGFKLFGKYYRGLWD